MTIGAQCAQRPNVMLTEHRYRESARAVLRRPDYNETGSLGLITPEKEQRLVKGPAAYVMWREACDAHKFNPRPMEEMMRFQSNIRLNVSFRDSWGLSTLVVEQTLFATSCFK